MSVERCSECGFDGGAWTDEAALAEIRQLGARWRTATDGLGADGVQRRPIADMWSIGEYAVHVREVLFSMRFVLDSAVAQPGIDLGQPPEPAFEPSPRTVDLPVALGRLAEEADALHDRLVELSAEAWRSTAVVGGQEVDARWISRHAVHDASHHLMDVARLRQALAR